jgi:hypothetical protein
MIYFTEKDNEIRIGFSDGLKKRLKAHGAYGYKAICCLPGTEVEEDRIHKVFEVHLIRGKDFFRKCDQILEYCCLLLDRGFAHPNEKDAAMLPQLPYNIWGPEFLQPQSPIETNGQLSIFPILPVGERIKVLAAQAQNHSITDEWFTPEYLIDLARKVLRTIDTDPATSYAVNQKFIKANVFYSKSTNGLNPLNPWIGNVWLNPPYGRGENSAGEFIKRLQNEVVQGNVTGALTCLNVASMTSKWFYSVMPSIARMHCILNGRPNFIPPDGKPNDSSPNKGIVISYVGKDTHLFLEVFGKAGQMLIPAPQDGDSSWAEMWRQPFDYKQWDAQ